MPELAEVEFYRKCWNPGLNQKITDVSLHREKRVFRRTNTSEFVKLFPGTRLVSSEAKGKQLLFHFTRDLWLNVHLGMSGELRLEKANFSPGKHDHLVLFQKDRALVFADQRQFGRVDLYQGRWAPDSWRNLPPSILSDDFSIAGMEEFLLRHGKLPIKATLLFQEKFPGVGNWMADEILWRAHIHPKRLAGNLSKKEIPVVFKEIRYVAREALISVALKAQKSKASRFSEPPKGWLFHERWNRSGRCPIHLIPLHRETIRGRTAVWCSCCQRFRC